MHRSLRTLLVLLAAGSTLLACAGGTGPAGAPGSAGAAGKDGADGTKGDKGDPGTKGDPGIKGDPGTTIGTVSGAVTDGVTAEPLAGVAVVAFDSGGAALADATTDGSGHYSLQLSAGALQLSLTKSDYTSPPDIAVGVVAGRTVTVNATMNEAASGKPSVALSAPGNDFGFGATATVIATATSPLGRSLSYVWSNATSPTLGTVSGNGGGDGATASVTLPTMAEAFAPRVDAGNPGGFISGYVLDDRFGVVPVLTDTRGRVTARVAVSDGHGQSATASIMLDAASLSPGLRNVAFGTRVYVNSGHAGANAWTLIPPSGSTAALDDPTSRTPSFVADKTGSYALSEGANSMTVVAGDWQGVVAGGTGDSVTLDSSCTVCHNGTIAEDQFTPWLGTGHATQFTRGLNGGLGSSYGSSCVECHTVGYDTGAANNGFDDVARAAGWQMPSTVAASNWETLAASAPTVARLANIQCENCHGPQNSGSHISTDPTLGQAHRPFIAPRISFGAEACGTCHAAGSHHVYSEWATLSPPEKGGVQMAHSKRSIARTTGAGATGLNSSCGRCHTAQGFLLFVNALRSGKVALDSNNAALRTQMTDVTSANAEPVTCVACHDPHDATNPSQLRIYGDTGLLPSGFAGYGLGKGALCVSCHNSRNGAQTGSLAATYLHEDGESYNSGNPTGYSAPHQAAQGDVFLGRNAYFLGSSLPMLSKHSAIADTCVGCHMTLQPKTYVSHGTTTPSEHLFRILDEDQATLCANCHGKNVDGASIQGTVEAQLHALATKLGNAAKTKINAFPGGVVHVRAWDESTDLYSSTSASNLVLDVMANPITSVGIEEIHGQVGLVLSMANPVTIQFVDGSGNPSGAPKQLQTFGVQMGALKDNQATPASLYLLTGNFVRGGWNYFLIEGDQSRGLHNPSFVQAVLNASLAKDYSN